jgi:hypothetical protein
MKIVKVIKEFFKALTEFVKRFWWLILALVAFVGGAELAKKKQRQQLKTELGEIKKRKTAELEKLEKELEKLKAEEKIIYDKKHFNNADEAIEYLNEVLKKLKK